MGLEKIGREMSEQAIAAMLRNELRGIIGNVENFLTDSRIARMSNDEWSRLVSRIFEQHDKFERQAATAKDVIIGTINPDVRTKAVLKKVMSTGIDPDVRMKVRVQPSASTGIDPDVRATVRVQPPTSTGIDPDLRATVSEQHV